MTFVGRLYLIEHLEFADCGKRVLDVLKRRLSFVRPTHGKDVEANVDFAEEPFAAEIASHCVGQLPLLRQVHAFNHPLEVDRFRRADFDDDERVAVEGEEIDFAAGILNVDGQNAKSLPAKRPNPMDLRQERQTWTSRLGSRSCSWATGSSSLPSGAAS